MTCQEPSGPPHPASRVSRGFLPDVNDEDQNGTAAAAAKAEFSTAAAAKTESARRPQLSKDRDGTAAKQRLNRLGGHDKGGSIAHQAGPARRPRQLTRNADCAKLNLAMSHLVGPARRAATALAGRQSENEASCRPSLSCPVTVWPGRVTSGDFDRPRSPDPAALVRPPSLTSARMARLCPKCHRPAALTRVVQDSKFQDSKFRTARS